MGSVERKTQLAALVKKYKLYKSQHQLDATSEQTIRDWLSQLLAIFNWDTTDTSQIIQGKRLEAEQRKRLKQIGSTYNTPDYAFLLGKKKITFLDAKDATVNIKNDKECAFQIRSYGWSASAPCAFMSNFEEFAIFDCSFVPNRSQPASIGCIYVTLDEYVSKFDLLDKHLLKENIYSGELYKIYSGAPKAIKGVVRKTPDYLFAEQLSSFRLTLAKAILANNKSAIKNNSDVLSYMTQVIINRILFIRVCEARKIENEGLLKEFHSKGFWKSFKTSSHFAFYEHYDGPLFERLNDLQQLQIPDKTFDCLIEQLYYPSPYRFDVIPTKLFSDIYELFLSKRLVITSKGVQDQFKSEYTKTKGAVSTPQFIVKEIIAQTIEKDQLVKGGVNYILNQKIVDISCGSGAFLIGTYDYLEEILIELYLKKKAGAYSEYFVMSGGTVVLTLEGRRLIMQKCIYGVDIDAEAVEVAKMSLCLKAIDAPDHADAYTRIGYFGKNILRQIGENIKCGNSLVDTDITTQFPTLQTHPQELEKTNAFDWRSQYGFADIFASKNGFDYVIGNPPYVEVKNYNIDLPTMHQYLKTKYSSAVNGKVDLAIPFIQRGMELLNNTGRLGYIIQKRFFKTDYGKQIREYIAAHQYVRRIVSFEETNLFKGRTTYVAIMVLQKAGSKQLSYRTVTKISTSTTASENIVADQSAEVKLPSTTLNSAPWDFSDIAVLSLRSRLLPLGTVGDFATLKVGIQTLWDKAYHIRASATSGGIITGKSAIDHSVKVEIEACRPLICNERFYPFRTDDPDVYVLFPYDITPAGVKEIKMTDFTKRYPLAAAYLKKHQKLIMQNVETNPENENWHLYTRVQNHDAKYAKILIPMTAKDTFAAITQNPDLYCDNANVYFIKIPNQTPNDLKAIAAIINSTAFSVLARSFANPQMSGYFKFNKQFIEPVPFPAQTYTNNPNVVAALATVVDKITILQQQYRSAGPVQKRTYVGLLSKLWEELDLKVYNLYGMTANEIQYCEAKGRNADRITILN